MEESIDFSRAHTVLKTDSHVAYIFYNKGDHWVDVYAYEVCAWGEDGSVEFAKKDEVGNFTANLNEAEITFFGNIKWDGCSNLTFFKHDEGYNHFCGNIPVMEFCNILMLVYRKSADIIENMQPDYYDPLDIVSFNFLSNKLEYQKAL